MAATAPIVETGRRAGDRIAARLRCRRRTRHRGHDARLQLPGLIRSQAGLAWILPVLVIVATLLVMRIAWVLPLAAFQHWRHIGADERPIWQVPAVVSWAGARGVVPLAAALSLPDGVPDRNLLLLLAIGATVVSLVVQGFTLGSLVRRVELSVPRENAAGEYEAAWRRLAEVGEAHLAELESHPPALIERARQSLRARQGGYGQLRQDLVRLQSQELEELHRAGRLAETTRRRIQRELDLDAERFSGH